MITLSQKHELLLLLFKEVMLIANENNVNCFPRAGTLLGVIRHQGLIPWDDDIDLEIPINEYSYFIDKLRESNMIKVYYQDVRYENSFARVSFKETNHLNLHIDLFPSIGLDESDFKNKMLLKKINFFSILRKMKYKKIKNVHTRWKQIIFSLLYIVKIPLIFISNNFLNKRIDKLLNKYSFVNANKVVNPFSRYGVNSIFEKRYYSELVNKQLDGIDIKIPFGYNEMLTSIYGNYMKIPDEYINFDSNNVLSNIDYNTYEEIMRCLKNDEKDKE